MLEAQHREPGRARRRPAATLLLAAVAALAAGAASAAEQTNDPLEHLNRATYAFNDALDRMLARPVAKAYKAVVPEKARQVVGNFLGNLAYPTVIVNDALQAKFKDAGTDSVRFVVNTVLGIGGLFDPATRMGLATHDEDFGQTLGVWGVPAGPYLVLPFLGPSDFRDAPARAVDLFTRPEHYLRNSSSDALSSNSTSYILYGMRLVDLRTSLLSTDEALRQAFDAYALVRNAYLARREYLVRDGNIPLENFDEPEAEPDSGSSAPPAAPTAPPDGQGAAAPPPAAAPPAGEPPAADTPPAEDVPPRGSDPQG